MEHTSQTTVETPGVDTEKIFHTVRMEVIESYPSIFSKDDVILLIDRIQKDVRTITPKVSTETIENLRDELISEMNDVIGSYDYDSEIEVELNDREIQVDFNHRGLRDEIEEKINEVIDEHISK